jgi:glutamyl/glutaminyl-tRNA synthetase
LRLFSLDRVNKSGAVFNIEKLDWLNAEHLRNKSGKELVELLRVELVKENYNNLPEEYLLRVIEVMKESVSFIREIPEKGFYFFKSLLNMKRTPLRRGGIKNQEKILKNFSKLLHYSGIHLKKIMKMH